MTASPKPRSTADEIAELARALTAAAHQARALEVTHHDRTELAVQRAHATYAFRRRRDKLLGPDKFADPAWDMLIDLFIASHHGRLTPVSSACIGATVAMTTGLRWIDRLQADGLIVSRADPDDKRLRLLRLSDEAFAAMVELFAGAPST